MSVRSSLRVIPWLIVCGVLLVGAGFFLGKGGVDLGRPLETLGRPQEGGGGGRESGAEGEREAAGRGEVVPEESGVVHFEPETLKLADLRVEAIGYRSVPSRLAVTGTVEPNLAGVVRVTARVAGKIQSVRVNVGDRVPAGQPLATLASTDLAQAQAADRQASAQLAVTETDLQRQRKLAGLGAFARPAVEAARGQATTAEADVRTARADVASAEAGVRQAESGLRTLQAELEQAQTQAQVTQARFRRAELLLKEELVSRQEWEQAQADARHAEADVMAARARIAQGQAGVETARSNVEAAQAKLAAAESRSRIAAQALEREQAVYRGGFTTSKEIVAAEAAVRQARLALRAAAESIRLLGGTPGGGNLLTIAAPLAGRVTERFVTLGETVTPDKSLFTLTNLRTVWVQLNVYQQDLPAVHVGQAVAVTADTAPGHAFNGRVSYVGDVVDESTRTVRVRCVVANPADTLKPGAFVRGGIATAARARALVAPRNAVQQMNGQSVVFVPADKPGEFRPHPVEVGAALAGVVEIRSGLKAGQRIVTRNAFLVKSQATKGQFGEEEGEGASEGGRER
jgi:membrane fusion protein, heavy metal efflux system